jgi:hypothetical protein
MECAKLGREIFTRKQLPLSVWSASYERAEGSAWDEAK